MKREDTDITETETVVKKNIVNRQQLHWEKIFENTCSMFGNEPSYPARKVAAVFEREGKNKIIELGSGQGRDTCFFVSKGFHVHSLDYTESGLKTVKEKIGNMGLSDSIITLKHDVRQPLPFESETFDACYSHMLYCMALTTAELEFLSSEIKRVLKPGGLNIYTARTTADAQYRTGTHRGMICMKLQAALSFTFLAEKRLSNWQKDIRV
jgi:ubiquinone/menaquinone biosynthesis C-methylase UbiE